MWFASLFLFENIVPTDSVFSKDEMIDTIGVTKGHGYQGVVTRCRATRLPCKTHRGLDKAAFFKAWHTACVSFIMARAGQRGYYHKVGMNKKVYKIGKAGEETHMAATKYDPTDSRITPYQYSFVLVLIHFSTLS